MKIAERQRRFYEELYRRHGDSPAALSYRDRETQFERFARLARLFEGEQGAFSVHEVGCGLGHFGDYLTEHHPRAAYSGSDICPEFVARCAERHPASAFFLRDVARELPGERYDFVTQSGMFNPRLDSDPAEWREFVFGMLDAMYALTRKGIAANFLSSYHDAERAQDSLHYQEPAQVIDHVARRLSRHWEIDAAGPLYEFTLRVYRPDHVRARYGGDSFRRYFRDTPA